MADPAVLRPPRAILFDLFHTLTSAEAERQAGPMIWEHIGADRDRWNRLLSEGSRWRLAGEETDPLAILRRLAEGAGVPLAEPRLREVARLREERFRRILRDIPEANVAALREIAGRGIRLGLVSNADAVEIAGWDDSPLNGLFRAETFSCRVGSVKPEAGIFRACLAGLGGIAPEDCWFVGDGGCDELLASAALGLEPVLVSGVVEALRPGQGRRRWGEARRRVERVPDLLGLLTH